MKHLIKMTIVIIAIFIINSCSENPDSIIGLTSTVIDYRGDRVAGRNQKILDISSTRAMGKFNNPYYIGTIKAAYNKLKSEGKISANYNIVPNALYIRYLPLNENELYVLGTNPNLELSEFPLQENDINNLATHHYNDGTLADNQIPFQYTVCNIGGILPNFEVDILDTLFLNHVIPVISDGDWRLIETEAFISTGVIDQNDPNAVQESIFCNEWVPSGRIEIWDDAFGGYIPLKRAKVVASRWFKWVAVETNSNGNFSMLPFSFCGKVTYKIKWENPIWDIRDGELWQAVTEGPNKKGAWNHSIRSDQKSLGFGSVHRSLLRYFFEDVAGLRRPFPGPQYLKISYKHEEGNDPGDLGFFSSSGFEGLFYSHIHIFGFVFGNLRPTQGIFSTTSHELAHLAHAFQMGNIQFWQVSDLLVESWARACQWKVTELEYGFSPPPVPGPVQNWFFTNNENIRSLLFIDLEDTFNQGASNSLLPNDVVSGYNLGYIQSNVLGHSYGLSSLRDRLKSQKPSGVTDAQIDTNLQYYFNHF